MSLSFLLGFVTPILPLAGPQGLLLVATAFLVLHALAGKQLHIRWAGPWLAVVFVWLVSECFFGWDPAGAANRQRFPPLGELAAVLPFWHYAVLAGLFSFFVQNPDSRPEFLRGLECGLGVAALTAGWFLVVGAPLPFPNRSEFFESIGREPGTFSDPNALGVFLACALPLLVARARTATGAGRGYLLLLAAALATIGLYSGSRAFLLGAIVYGVWLAWRYGKGALFAIGACIVVFVAGLNAAVAVYPADTAAWMRQLPLGLARAFETVTVGSSADAIFSRLAFWRIGFALWLDHFFFGVGPQRFADYVVQYAHQLGLPLGTWSDNSNNFYLGVLAQTGVLGAFALLLSMSNLQWRSEIRMDARAALIVLAVLLFVGPHLEFDEVTVLTAFLLAMACEIRGPHRVMASGRGLVSRALGRESTFDLRARLVAVACAGVLLSGIFLSSLRLQRGLYPWEREGEEYFRWTAGSAQMTLRCSPKGSASLAVRALNPDLVQSPLFVSIEAAPKGKVLEYSLDSAVMNEVQISCPFLAGTPFSEQSVRVRITASRTWSPRDFALGGDGRQLGVQVFVPPASVAG